MKLMSEAEYNDFVANNLYLPVRVHNNVLDEDKYVLLEPADVRKIDLNAIRDFVRKV